jgi:rhamnosyltransferase
MVTKVSVIIPTKNGGDLFEELLTKLQTQVADFDYELVVVDSGSTDRTTELAEQHGAIIYRVKPIEFNHGATRNFAIGKSSGDIIILMTQDAIPADNFLLQEIVLPFLNNSNVGGVYARQSPRPEADPLTKRNLNGWLTGREQPDQKKIEDRSSYDTWSPIERYLFCNFDNVCSAVRRSTWERIQFQPISFGEDIDWSKRALESGWTIAYTPKAHVIHSHDRPISYEFKRTYMCHQTLYRLFGVRTVPSFKHALRSIAHASMNDWKYVMNQSMPTKEKFLVCLKIPLLAVASVWGQYRGAHEEANNQARTMAGV